MNKHYYFCVFLLRFIGKDVGLKGGYQLNAVNKQTTMANFDLNFQRFKSIDKEKKLKY